MMSSSDSPSVRKLQMGEIGMLEVAGSLDLTTLPPLRSALQDLLGRGVKHLVINLLEVSYIDSAGISVLLSAKRGVIPHKGEVFVVTRTNEVQLALKIVQIDRVVNLVDSVEVALELLTPPPPEGRAV